MMLVEPMGMLINADDIHPPCEASTESKSGLLNHRDYSQGYLPHLKWEKSKFCQQRLLALEIFCQHMFYIYSMFI